MHNILVWCIYTRYPRKQLVQQVTIIQPEAYYSVKSDFIPIKSEITIWIDLKDRKNKYYKLQL